jgi:cytochrome c biogenesis protein CcmG, thiol:disulfide interchange protein DsbE
MALVRGIIVALWLLLSGMSIASDNVLRVAPDITRTDIKGDVFSLNTYRGKLVLLNFWATWCGPCLTEIPRFVAWQRTYGPAGLQIVGISMDDELAPVKRAYQKFQMDYPVLMGDPQLAEQFGGVLGLPLSYLIDADGRIAARYQGDLDLKKLELRIKSLLPRR